MEKASSIRLAHSHRTEKHKKTKDFRDGNMGDCNVTQNEETPEPLTVIFGSFEVANCYLDDGAV